MRERFCSIYVEDLSDGVAAPFEERSFLCFISSDKNKYRTYVLFCQYHGGCDDNIISMLVP